MQQFGLVFASQNMPRLVKPYIVMNVLNVEIPDHVTYGQTINAAGVRSMWSWRKAVVELQFYNGIESLTSASLLAMYLQSELSLLSQDRLNCAIGARLFFSYVPELVNRSQYEGRAIYHFEYFYTEMVGDDVGLIETVVVDGTYTGGADDENKPIVCHEEITYVHPFESTTWDDGTVWDTPETIWDEIVTNG